MNYITLKERHRAERDDYPQSTSLRLHRALSWLDRAEQCEDDPDAQFILRANGQRRARGLAVVCPG